MGTKPDEGDTPSRDGAARKSGENMVLLVRLVKSMREMGYESYLGETRYFDSQEVD
jgi:hypothetical protein